MPVDILVGLQWGDEGKGRVVAGMGDYKACVRVNGGPNAGHTVDPRRGADVHQVPPMILDADTMLVIASGSVVDIEALIEEVNHLESLGFEIRSRLMVSEDAHVLTQEHRDRDQDEHSMQLGTTRTGNGPVYADKYARVGRRVGDEIAKLSQAGISVLDTTGYLGDLDDRGKPILLMVAHGTMLDIDHGTYPFVTSSHCTAGGALASAGLGPTAVRRVIGVAKPYTTRVAAGPMRGEMPGSLCDLIRLEGYEYGTTTGRPRRVGWMDLGQLRYACRLNSVSEIIMNKMDVLAGIDPISVVKSPWDLSSDILEQWRGWHEVQMSDAGLFRFVKRVEDELYPAKIRALGFGPTPDDTLPV